MLEPVESSLTISWLKRFTSKAHRPYFWSWLLFFGLFALLCSPNLLFANLVSLAGQLEYREGIIYGLGFWILWFALFPKIWMGLGLALIPAVWLFPSLYLRDTYQAPITSYFYSMFAETDLQELQSFISVFGLPFFGGTLTTLALIGCGVFVTHKYQIGFHRRLRQWIVLTFFFFLAVLFIIFNRNATKIASTE